MQRVNIIRFQAYRNLISWISSFCYTALLSVFLDTTGTELRLADLPFCKSCILFQKCFHFKFCSLFIYSKFQISFHLNTFPA